MSEAIETVVLGATGYVAGEALRLIAGHPVLALRAAVSRSRAGKPVASTFSHLAPAYPHASFAGHDELAACLDGDGPLAVLSCLPHGESAALVDELLAAADDTGRTIHLVDLSADFRLPTAARYEEVYGRAHGAPGRLDTFTCDLPELHDGVPAGPVAHPGCFTTAVTLACAPLHALGLAEGTFRVSAITGSTGSGRTPSPTTHHPERHGNVRVYKPLAHRHAAEMELLVGRRGADDARVAFVPCSGPFARGICATIHVALRAPTDAATLADAMAGYYADAPFVGAGESPPALKDVVGTNHCRLGVAASGRDAVVISVIDNLTKGAAGGAVQWLNRLLGLPDDTGLRIPGFGWS